MCAGILEGKHDTIACEHDRVQVLGYSGNAEFLRCQVCRQVVVVQGGRTWFIRGTAEPQRLIPAIH